MELAPSIWTDLEDLYVEFAGSGRVGRTLIQRCEVHHVWRSSLMARVRPARVVEVDVVADAFAGGAHGLVSMWVDLLVLDRALTSFDEHVVAPAALAVLRDADAVFEHQAGERAAGELPCVEDFRSAVLRDRFFDGFGAERRVHRGRQAPSQHAPVVPVDHGGHVREAARHRDVGDFHRPDMVRPGDRQLAQQVGVARMADCLLAHVRLAIQRRDACAPRQLADVLAPDCEAFGSQQVAQHTRAGGRQFQAHLADASHQLEVGVADWPRLVVRRATADAQ